MRRGEIWTVSGGPDYLGKPRPVLILQSNSFEGLGSVTICPFTSDETEAPLLRLVITPTPSNGLREISRLMIDKVTTVPNSKLGAHIGHMSDDDMLRLNRSLLVFLGLTD